MTFELLSNQCSEWINYFAIFGLVAGYGILSFITSLIIAAFKEEELDENTLLLGLLFPILIIGAIIGGIGYYLYRLIILPIVAATKQDLSETFVLIKKKR